MCPLPLWLLEPDLVRFAPYNMSLVASRRKFLAIARINRMLLGAAAVLGSLAHGQYLISRDSALALFAAAGNKPLIYLPRGEYVRPRATQT